MKPVESMTDEELDRRADRLAAWERNRPHAMAAAIFFGVGGLGALAALILGGSLGFILACGGMLGFIGVSWNIDGRDMETQAGRKPGRNILRIDRERKMRARERSRSFQEKVVCAAEGIRGFFGEAAMPFLDGTENGLAVKKPLQFKKPGGEPKKKSFFGPG